MTAGIGLPVYSLRQKVIGMEIEEVTITPAQAQRNLQSARKRGKMAILLAAEVTRIDNSGMSVSDWIRWASEQADEVTT
jgi:ABC-type transporter Mla MlaB component